MKQKNQQERDLITRPHENSFMGEFDIAHCGQFKKFLFNKNTRNDAPITIYCTISLDSGISPTNAISTNV